VDWQDSLIQAIELAYWLGFRDLYFAGCELHVKPGPEHLDLAAERGVTYQAGELLRAFYERSGAAGLTLDAFERSAVSRPYHFDETKSLAATIQTDWHYFRVVQYLRLSRRAMALAGLQLVSVTPGSRLNDFFPYRPAEDVLRDLRQSVGNPATEPTLGQYARERPNASSIPMRDFKPHNWGTAAQGKRRGSAVGDGGRDVRVNRLRDAMADLAETPVGLDEIG
jgi:hypothetical protein